jgi:hypothetical protein
MLTGMRRLIALVGLAMLTSGCATYSWSRPDTPPELAARDQAECYDLARWAPRPWPTLGWPIWSDPYWGPGGDPLWRLDAEQRIHERCMRSRGYDLQREPKA